MFILLLKQSKIYFIKNRQNIKQILKKLLNSLHRNKHCNHLQEKGDPLSGQKYYNGFLKSTFNRCNKIIRHEFNLATKYCIHSINNDKDKVFHINKRRNSLFKELSLALYSN